MDNDKIKVTDRAVYDAANTGDIYQSSASAYALFKIEKEWIERKLAEIKINSKYKFGLDVGCGGGGSMPWLAHHCDYVIGLDHSIKAARNASRDLPNTDNFAVMQADAEFVPLKDCSAGLIFCGSILHHLPSYQNSLKGFGDCLNENGVLVATEPCAYNPFAVIRRKYFPSIFHTPDERPFPPKEIIAEFKKNFDLVYYRRIFILSTNAAVVEQFLGKMAAAWYLKLSMLIDSVLLRIPLIRDLCWRIDLIGLKLPKPSN